MHSKKNIYTSIFSTNSSTKSLMLMRRQTLNYTFLFFLIFKVQHDFLKECLSSDYLKENSTTTALE